MQNTASSVSNSSISSSSQAEELSSIADTPGKTSPPVEILKGPAAARKKKLEDDPWTAHVSTTSVTCLGCGHLVRLSTKSLYDNHHWLMHKQRCKKAGHMKDNPDIGQPSPHPPAPVQTKPKARSKPNRKTRRAPSASSSVSSLTPISTPPLTSDEDDMSSIEENELPPRSIPVRASGKRDLLTEQYFARAHGIRIRLPPVLPDIPDTPNWRSWDWSELRMPEFNTGPAPSSDGGLDYSKGRVTSDVGMKSEPMSADTEGSRTLQIRSTRAQPRGRGDPIWTSSSYQA